MSEAFAALTSDGRVVLVEHDIEDYLKSCDFFFQLAARDVNMAGATMKKKPP
jgi:hypothetical protein